MHGNMATKHIALSDKERAEILMYLPVTHALHKKLEKAGKRITTSSARGKGMSFQKWVCTKLSDLLGETYIPGDDESAIASRNSGGNGTDIILRGGARKKFPFSVECKAQESMSLVDAIKQAETNETPTMRWMLVHKRKALTSPVVIMAWDVFAELYGRVLKAGLS
jgi:hypothetical protein